MQKLTATFRIVTPMFIAGADQNKAELRAPSIKGALRFWWRALNWAQIRQASADDQTALKKLKEDEGQLFGDADDAGQSSMLIVVRTQRKPRVQAPPNVHSGLKPNGNNNHMAGARYLAYGLIVAFSSRNTGKKAGQLERACIDENQTFEVQIISRNRDPGLIDALKFLGLLGGIGSRSRRGYGSLLLEKICEDGKEEPLWETPEEMEAYTREITDTLRDYGCDSLVDLPPISAFYRGSMIQSLITGNSCYTVLNKLGLKMLDYRSWGQSTHSNRLPSGITSEKRFKDDHDWFKSKHAKRKKDFHPRRVVLGLPHNYSKNTNDHVTAQNHERRASPLLFHVHQFGRQYVGVAIFLKSRFLPDGEGINAGGDIVPQNIDWRVITEFLDGKVGNPPPADAKNRFPDKEVIFP